MHWARRAASRPAWTAGNKRAIRTPMMAMTTNSSISVKPRRVFRNGGQLMLRSPRTNDGDDADDEGILEHPARMSTDPSANRTRGPERDGHGPAKWVTWEVYGDLISMD